MADGQRLGLHNLRHTLSNWMVSQAKVEPKTVQGILRHAKVQTTLDHTQEDDDEALAAQGGSISRRSERLRTQGSRLLVELWLAVLGFDTR